MIAWICLAGLERQQVDDGGAAGRAVLHRDLVGLEPVHPAPVGEEQQVGVGRGVDDVGDVVLVLAAWRPATPRPPRPWVRKASAATVLMYPLARHGDDEVLVVDEVLDVEVADVVGDLGCAGVGRTRSTDLASSSLMTLRSLPSSARMASSSAMVSRSSASSSSSLARPRRVSRPSCMSRMCSAWTSENSNGSAMSASRAAPLSSDGPDGGDDLVDEVEGLDQPLDDVGPVPGLVADGTRDRRRMTSTLVVDVGDQARRAG